MKSYNSSCKSYIIVSGINEDLEQDDEMEIPVEIEFSYTKEVPAVMYLPNGDPGYPSEPAEIEITNVIGDDGNEYDFDELSEDNQNILYEKACDWVSDHSDSYGDYDDDPREPDYD